MWYEQFTDSRFECCVPRKSFSRAILGTRAIISSAILYGRLLRSWVRIPPGAWMFVCFECCVLSGRGLCHELITRPEESYRLWCVVVCDLETSRMRRPWSALGRSATGKKMLYGVLPLLIQNKNGFLQLNYTHVTALTWQIFEVGPHECHLGSVVIHMKERNLPLLFSEYKEYLKHSRQSLSILPTNEIHNWRRKTAKQQRKQGITYIMQTQRDCKYPPPTHLPQFNRFIRAEMNVK